MYYVTLHQVKQSIGLDTTESDALLTKYIRWAAGFVEQYKSRRYDVRLAVIPHDAPIARSSSFGVYDRTFSAPGLLPPLTLEDDLLEMV